MVRGNIYRRRIKEQSLGQTAFLFRNAGEPLQFLRVYNRKVETSLGRVVEEDGVDDFPSGGSEAEGDVRDSEDRLDIRDLLLDETD